MKPYINLTFAPSDNSFDIGSEERYNKSVLEAFTVDDAGLNFIFH